MKTIKKFQVSAALVSGISMWVALSACGSSPEETPDDVHEYCASVDYADEICNDLAASAESLAPAPAAHQSAGVDGWLASPAR